MDHVWSAKVSTRKNGSGCAVCSGFAVVAGVNDLATVDPELAAQAYGWDPKTVTQWTGQQFEWQCSLLHVWLAAVRNRSNGNGCPYCANKEVLVGFNDVATTHPKIASEAHGWDATTVVAGSHKTANWICGRKMHTWSATVEKRTTREQNCPYCAGRRVWVGDNDLAATDPLLAEEAYGWDPRMVTRGSDKMRKWICEKKHVWTSTVSNRTSGGNGCPSCSETGFDPNLPGYLYLIEHLEQDLIQVGITVDPERRLSEHARRGWTPIEVQGPWGIGEVAHQWEQSILR